jgi:hypothetical protein
MHVSIRKYNINDATKVEEIANLAAAGFIPIISQSPGFIAYYGIATGPDEIATISIFEDQAGAEESTRRAGEWVRQNLAQHVSKPPQIIAGDILFHATA